ncbi:hypothetical protein [Pararhizobium mangrovi]|uniref:DUF945 domain-containing protein n=1 Tax=Pararhizobium mangrovi TaxID=2590452 RepID=A0A506UFY4_9HYPH|nr:hypothetical protein [Pararhizobium mangrovi]TPW32074.1 hypothetical protein FJU11_02505 [Pararhizobium mangrovi]
MHAKPYVRAALAGTFLLGFASSALALDGKDFVTTLNAAYGRSGGTLDYSRLDTNGDTVILHDTALKLPSGPVPLGEVTFSGVEETDGGGYTVDTTRIPKIDRPVGAKGAVSVEDIQLDGLVVPPQGKGDDKNDDKGKNEGSGLFPSFTSSSTGDVRITRDGKPLVTSSGVKSTIEQAGKGYESSTDVEDLTIYLDNAGDSKLRRAAKAMGYDSVNGEMTMKGSWSPDGGKADLSKLALTLKNVGTLDLSLGFSGYTRDFIEQTRDLQAKAAANPDDKEAQKALGIGMLGLMQQLSFTGAKIRFDDDSLTNKVLSYIGKQQGVSGDQIAQAAKAMLPLALGKLKNPGFEKKVEKAVSTFLDDPKSLTIEADPEKPVSAPLIVGAAMASPQSLPDVLDVDVSANDKD